MAETHFIKIQKTARYYTLGKPNLKVKHLWFMLHGYGQLGKFFIRNFTHLESEERLIIAPEAPNRFYLNGSGGRVGATWMTKEERLRDIDDYCDYLNLLAAKVLTALPTNVKVHVFGFSQGVATAFRWVNNFNGNGINSLHAWAGTFPPDIDYKLNRQKFNALNITSSFALRDKYISAENANLMMLQLKEMQIDVKQISFDGEHKIYPKPLTVLIKNAERSQI